MNIAAKTDIGKQREINEDSLFVPMNENHIQNLVIVADGMGGHKAGEVASSIAVEIVQSEIKAMLQHKTFSPARMMRRAIRNANKQIFLKQQDDMSLKGMGTTISMALLYDDMFVTGHVGDSRIYLLHNGSLSKVTRDHSLVEELVRIGKITMDEAKVHPHRNVITRCLGSFSTVEMDSSTINWDKGDMLLLCSDGLTRHVSEEEIEEILKSGKSCEAMADELLAKALERGGLDNISHIVVCNE